jgi:high affinity sulfate transporter 1
LELAIADASGDAQRMVTSGRSGIPGLRLARSYQRRWARRDLVAGLALTALLVPQGMAYAELAGLPPVTGLYTTVIVLLAYAAFGRSRVFVLGPDSSIAPLIAAAVLPLVASSGDPSSAVALASALALMIGLMCIVAGRARLGAIADLFSKPVRVGFLNGIALVVIVSQLPALFGFDADDTRSLGADLRAFTNGVVDGDTVVAALALGIGSLALISVCALVAPRFPAVLIAVVGSAIVTGVFDLAAHGVSVVGAIPTGFPAPRLPDVTFDQVRDLVVAAFGVTFVMVADTIILSRAMGTRSNEHVDPDAEIVALGAANLGAGLFGGFPASASSTRTLVAEASGAQTQVTGVVAATATAAVLVVGSGLGRDLPSATLAAVVIAGAMRLFDARTAMWLLRVRRSEFTLLLTAFGGVALLGVLEGVAVAIGLSIATFVWRAWRPYDAVLGRVAGRKGYHDIERHPEAVEIPGLVLYRFDAPLFFANAERFARRVEEAIARRSDPTRWVIVAAEPLTDIDTTAAEVLSDLLDEFEARGIALAFAELKGPVKDRLRDYGLYDRVNEARFFPTLGTAIDAYLGETGTEWIDWTDG